MLCAAISLGAGHLLHSPQHSAVSLYLYSSYMLGKSAFGKPQAALWSVRQIVGQSGAASTGRVGTGEATDGTGAGEIMATRQYHGVGSGFILFISIWGKVLASVETQGGGCQQKGPPVKPWNNSFSPAFVGPDSCYPNHPTSCSQPARSCRRQLYPLVIS